MQNSFQHHMNMSVLQVKKKICKNNISWHEKKKGLNEITKSRRTKKSMEQITRNHLHN